MKQILNAKTAAKITMAIVKAVIAAVKALVAAIAAGGWVVLLVILILHPQCKLGSTLVIPLRGENQRVMGTIKLYES